MKLVLPFESTTEIKLGLASVDSGESVIVLVVVPVKDTGGAWVTGETGDEAWSVGLDGGVGLDEGVGLDGGALVDPGLALGFEAGLELDFTTTFDRSVSLGLDFTTDEAEGGEGGGTEGGGA